MHRWYLNARKKGRGGAGWGGVVRYMTCGQRLWLLRPEASCGAITHAQTQAQAYALGPVREDRAVAAVCDELVRELCHGRVQVVLDHVLDGRGLYGFGWVPFHRVRLHLPVRGAEPVPAKSRSTIHGGGQFDFVCSSARTPHGAHV